ncbi:Hypothetical predicted protein, partial [Marmota monax]
SLLMKPPPTQAGEPPVGREAGGPGNAEEPAVSSRSGHQSRRRLQEGHLQEDAANNDIQ